MKVEFCSDYAKKLHNTLQQLNWQEVTQLAEALRKVWGEGRQVFLCGNGGSAANAIHLANDFIYGISSTDGIGLKATALPANQSVLTCLANDLAFEDIFSKQLTILGEAGDILIVFSGSGDSPNIVKSVIKGKELGMKTFAILGFSGGKCLKLVDTAIHFAIDDMQIAEDCQQIVGHIIMQWLSKNPPK
ncbi:MAG: SIS domain-containing protein [Candidatus Brocadiales bacterium]|nr:SIS domain-containing protein [Candidatus Brocadiales bacterium]